MSGRTLFRGGCVLTLGPKTANHAQADVLVEDGRIAEVGPSLRVRDAEVVDATDTIVMPGFVDTHHHLWQTLFRNVAADEARSAEEYGRRYQPDDLYAATLLGLLSAVESGTTTVVDWADLQVDERYTEAALQAHLDAGLRTVFVPTAPTWAEGEDAGALARRILEGSPGNLGPTTTVAFGHPEVDLTDRDRIASHWALARSLGLRIHAHAGISAADRGVVADLAGRGLLGPDLTLVHCSNLGDGDFDAIASTGTAASLTPSGEMAKGFGSPPLQAFIDRGIRPGLGVEDGSLASGDVFGEMRATQSLQHATLFDRKLAGKGSLPSLLSTREVIRYATIDGARSVGLAEVTGSIEPGKQADLLLLRTDLPNIFPVNDPIGAVVWGMDACNVHAVYVGGRPLLREGALEADVARVRALAISAWERVAGPAGELVASGSGGGG
jgi:5-methylthioadenosine/S-adenosylhomocysteine deaminase